MILREIEGTNGMYWVSRTGKIKVKRTLLNGSIKYFTAKASAAGKGYLLVGVNISGNRKNVYVHRAVALAFIPNPENKPQVNHIDGNKANNHYKNLEWSTCKENIHHAVKSGLFHNRDTHPNGKLSTQDVNDIKSRYTGKRGEGARLAREYGVDRVTIYYALGLINRKKT